MSERHGRTSSVRGLAWELLCVLRKGRDADVPLPALLDRAVRQAGHGAGLDRRDAGLVTELVYGVLRAEQRLFRLLALFLRDPDALPRELTLLLLAGVYEILFLDHIPARATLNECVGLARAGFGAGLGGLVNAVLRKVDGKAEELRREDAAFLGRDAALASVEDLAVAGALPLWLANMWAEQYGLPQAWHKALASVRRPSPCWRLNLSRPDREDCARLLREAGAVPVQDGTWSGLPAPLAASLERAGRVSRQGRGSASLAAFLAGLAASFQEAGAPLWDACCGRGGKSCALLERGVRVSLCSDPLLPRLDHLRGELGRLDLPRPEIRRGTVQELAPGRSFPLILLDVPCSGTGTLARNPELRWRLTPEKIRQLEGLQAEMLDAAWTALAPGGLLAYATCALNKGENEEQVAAFAARQHDCLPLPDARQSFDPAEGQDVLFLAVLRKAGKAYRL